MASITRTIAITSGKGGVGKTNLSVNLSLHLASLGYRTCLFDADIGLANINILLGLYPEHTIEDVILNNKNLSDIIIKDFHGIDIIPGCSGIEKIADIDLKQINKLIESFSFLSEYDFLFIDTSAGISKNVLSFCLSSSEIIIVITPEPTSLTDAYSLLKILCFNGLKRPVKVVMNQCKNTEIAKQWFVKFKTVAKQYLSFDVQPLGVILEDPKIQEAVKSQKPFITLFPESLASKCIKSLANNLLKNKTDIIEEYSIESFWERCISLLKSQLHLKITTGNKGNQQQTEKASIPQADKTNNKTIEAKSASKSGSEIDYLSNPGFYDLMKGLVNNISNISSELKQLRKAISKNRLSQAADRSFPETEFNDVKNRKPVELSFEEYLRERNKE